VTAAIDSAFQFGRNGLGCPVIFSSGNLGLEQPDTVAYPARLPSCLAVGAIDDFLDERWLYSQYGTTLDLVAPSGYTCFQGDVWTLDQMYNAGYNPNLTESCNGAVYWGCTSPTTGNDIDYDCNFGGTSAAAPIVSGAAALLLSKKPTLTAQQVYNILDSSAVTQLAWGPLPDTPHVEYGYGRVDAFRAILSISRGDLNNDGAIGNILDQTFLVNRIFRGGPYPFPSPLMDDCNCDGTANNILDLTFLIDFIFRGSGIPPKNPCFKF